MDITPDEARISDAMRQFGERLKNIRVGLGYTQPDLATKLGCKRQTLSSWEQGVTAPDIKTLLRLKEQARTDEKNPIEVDLGELLGERNTDFGRTPLEYAIRLLKNIDVMGIRDVHPTRSEALTSFLPFLESEQTSICIVASSFLGVTRVAPEQVATVLSEKATEVKEFKILMTHPEMSQWREKQEGRAEGSIELEIWESVRLLESWGVRSENIKFWRGAPTIFLLFTPERMLANPYTYQTEAFKSVTVEIAPTKSRDDVFSQYSMNHFKRPFESGNSITLVQLREEVKLREESGHVPKRDNRSRRS